jgi:hypothetical protein
MFYLFVVLCMCSLPPLQSKIARALCKNWDDPNQLQAEPQALGGEMLPVSNFNQLTSRVNVE